MTRLYVHMLCRMVHVSDDSSSNDDIGTVCRDDLHKGWDRESKESKGMVCTIGKYKTPLSHILSGCKEASSVLVVWECPLTFHSLFGISFHQTRQTNTTSPSQSAERAGHLGYVTRLPTNRIKQRQTQKPRSKPKHQTRHKDMVLKRTHHRSALGVA